MVPALTLLLAACGADPPERPDPACVPSCDGVECGDDGCGGSCGECTAGSCVEGSCVDDACVPSCGRRECGEDGCGGSCGKCTTGSCVGGVCVDDPCIPSCAGFECGDDGCGGSCGGCLEGACEAGACVVPPCVPNCTGRECGDDGCGGSCGLCAAGTCEAGACVVPPCVPSCDGRECGDDGCGGSCGACADGVCTAGVCVPDTSDDCADRSYTAYSCAAADPCGWTGDGFCDEVCAVVFPLDHFSDVSDCAANACGGECGGGWYTACTCAAADPCLWREDGYCDMACATAFPEDHFDDSGDCAGACGEDCVAGYVSACSCAAADPCGWQEDGFCDEQCAVEFPLDHFDDTADCSSEPTCEEACVEGRYTACTCAAADPCGWVGDGICDDVCALIFQEDHLADDADCP